MFFQKEHSSIQTNTIVNLETPLSVEISGNKNNQTTKDGVDESDQDIEVSNEKSQKLIYERAGKANNTRGIDITLPKEETFRLAGKRSKDLDEWKQVLEVSDQNANKYIVLPTQGLIMPLNTVPKNSQDYQKFIHGKYDKLNSYLEDGAFEIPGTSRSGYGKPGNKVISGHSSYFTQSKGRYKTHFQKIIEMEKGEQIWIFERQKDMKYKKYIYLVTESYNTPNDDISILKPSDKKLITLFTCTPIGGIESRWVIQGEFAQEK
ncbi:hypothetical protein CSB09_03065 [Candidatus Gracilibacteria bacterium]|nr:MAG: hypothetical protein CSB09_03065 [Candidatus Gracilibacteria bacterium]